MKFWERIEERAEQGKKMSGFFNEVMKKFSRDIAGELWGCKLRLPIHPYFKIINCASALNTGLLFREVWNLLKKKPFYFVVKTKIKAYKENIENSRDVISCFTCDKEAEKRIILIYTQRNATWWWQRNVEISKKSEFKQGFCVGEK